MSNKEAGTSVMLNILPAGRTSIMITRINVTSFSRSATGWIAPLFIADDDTKTGMIATINSKEEKSLDVLMPQLYDMSTKNAIKNIEFKVYGTGTVTADLICYGYVY